MFLILARPLLFTACLKFLPNAILDATDDANALPTPTLTSKPKKDWRGILARTIFAWTFTESSMLFLLLILQATNTSSSLSRTSHFQFSLYVLLAIHIILIPQSIALLVFAPSSPTALIRSPRTILFSFIPVILSLILLSYIPFYTDSTSPQNLLTRTLSRLILLGTIILGLLSGFGAVTRAWHFLPSSKDKEYDVVPTEEEIQSTEKSLQSVQGDLQKKRDELLRRTDSSPPQSPGSGIAMSWMKKVGDTLRGGDDLTLEIKGLQTLHDTLSLSLHSQRSKLAASRASRTLRGRIISFIGRLFAGYCIFRTFTAAYNTLLLRQQPQQARQTYPDIVTNILIWLLIPSSPSSNTNLTPESISSLTRHISLLLIGLIILSSIGLVMKSVNRALKVTSRTLGASIILLVLAYLMGIYLLSTLVQLRSSFPPPLPPSPPSIISNEIQETTTTTTTNLFTLIPPYELFSSLFDFAFLISAVVTIVSRWIADRISMVD